MVFFLEKITFINIPSTHSFLMAMLEVIAQSVSCPASFVAIGDLAFPTFTSLEMGVMVLNKQKA